MAVRVEEWIGTVAEGDWQPMGPWQVVLPHRFATRPANRNARKCDDRNPSLPRTGDKIECVLLADKTHKGGWKARLLKGGAEGPITNTADVPRSARTGQTVILRLGVISQDSKRIQFHWQQADKAREIDYSAYRMENGRLIMPDDAGFGLKLRR